MTILSHRLLLPILTWILIGTASCKEDPPAQALLPSNLQVEAEVSDEVSGLVEVTATAVNANFYSFIFEENGESEFQESSDGIGAYQYASSGDYTITVRAHATHDAYTEVLEVVSVVIEEQPTGDYSNPPTSGYESPDSYAGYTLVWEDDFDGTSLNTQDWNFEIGTGSSGWGNNELQYYREENTSVEDGILIIEARNEPFNGREYTSSRITTQNKQTFQYGRIDIRAAMPYGKGIWPALWMLGESFASSGWPSCGEIDIMEMVGGNVSGGGNNVVHGTVHWDNDGSYASFGGSKAISTGILADEFHVYSIDWDDQGIRWLLDGVQYHEIDITPADLSEFHQEFFFIFNVAVGGNWPGSPNANTTFPQRMYVDYVRVFQK